MPVLVEFLGRRYWYLGDSLEDLGHAVAPLAHCDEKGELFLDAVLEDSFAHVNLDGRIMRYGQQVGNVSDFVKIWEAPGE